jgi:dTDP-4-dehydrorhamnose 3,5-epimerase
MKEWEMKFTPTSLQDAVLIEQERHADARGYFARTFCVQEFERAGLETAFVQANASHNARAGTLRGMHFQRPPHGEVKLVRCVKGAIHDVIVDLRRDSPTYGRWEGFDLTEENGRMLYVPAGFAHGFQTLVDDTDVAYQVSHPYTAGAEGGLRWDDPAFGIAWSLPVTTISEKDASWPHVGRGVPSV